jgi:hypothetical protein
MNAMARVPELPSPDYCPTRELALQLWRCRLVVTLIFHSLWHGSSLRTLPNDAVRACAES